MVNVLLLGGHGKVALHMTRLLAARGHQVTSIIRNPAHVADIQSLCESPLVKPVVSSLEEATPESAKALMNGIDWVIWSAGAGGKGGKERTKAVDEVAAKKFIAAALEAESVKRFLMVSASPARHQPASWWKEDDLERFKAAWDAIPAYLEAKCAADDYLYAESRKAKKEGWEDICLRPGTLSDEPGTGKVDLGRSKLAGKVSREDVASVAVELLERGTGGKGLWIDLIQGEEDIPQAVERVVREGVTALE